MTDRTVTEVRLKVTWPNSRPSFHSKRDLDLALADAAKYSIDPLGRTAEVQTRQVTASTWQTLTP